jgi:hypothetical protein
MALIGALYHLPSIRAVTASLRLTAELMETGAPNLLVSVHIRFELFARREHALRLAGVHPNLT